MLILTNNKNGYHSKLLNIYNEYITMRLSHDTEDSFDVILSFNEMDQIVTAVDGVEACYKYASIKSRGLTLVQLTFKYTVETDTFDFDSYQEIDLDEYIEQYEHKHDFEYHRTYSHADTVLRITSPIYSFNQSNDVKDTIDALVKSITSAFTQIKAQINQQVEDGEVCLYPSYINKNSFAK